MKTTSLELSRRLAPKVKIETENYWVDGEVWDRTMQSDYETFSTPPRDQWIPAYTTDELMEWLPARIKTNDDDLACLEIHKHRGYEVKYIYYRNGIGYILGGYGKTTSRFNNESLPEALGLLAEYLVDNGIYKGKE